MKKFLFALFVTISMTGVAHADQADARAAYQECTKEPKNTGAECQAVFEAYGGVITGTTDQTQSAPQTSNTPSGFTALAPIPGLTDMSPTTAVGADSLANFFNNLYKYAVGMAAILAVIMIIWSGLEIAINKENVSSMLESKGRIYNAVFGLILVLSPVLVFSIINPSILNLSLNLPKIKPVARSSDTTTAPANPDAVAATTSGCNFYSGTLIKKASCPTWDAAQTLLAAYKNGSCNVSSSSAQYGKYEVICDTTDGSITGPYSFADTSQSTGLVGKLNAIIGYSYYEPLASTPTNSNNGSAVLQFASACTTDGGTTCMSTVKTPCASSVVNFVSGGPSASCWNISLSCTDGKTGAGGCSDNPQFTIVNSK